MLLFFKQWFDKAIPFGWNPFSGGGEPFYLLSNSLLWPQWLVFGWLNKLIEINPIRLFNLYWTFQYIHFCVGCFLLFLILYDDLKTSIFCFLSLVCSGMFFVNLGQPTGLKIIYYYPYILFCLISAVRTRQIYGLMLSMIILGISVNHYIPHYLILCVALFIIFAFIFHGDNLWNYFRKIQKKRRLITLAAVTTTLAASTFIFLFFEIQHYISPTRGGTTPGGAVQYGATGFQDCVNAPLWGYRVILDQLIPYRQNIHHGFYFGIVALLFLPLSIFKLRDKYYLTILASAASILLFSTGNDFWGYNFLIKYVPTFNMIRHSFGLAQFACLLLICLAGYGFKAWMAEHNNRTTLLLAILCYVVMIRFSPKIHTTTFGFIAIVVLSIWFCIRIRYQHENQVVCGFYWLIVLIVVLDLSFFYSIYPKNPLKNQAVHQLADIVYPQERTFFSPPSLFRIPPDISPLIFKKASITHPHDNFVLWRNRYLDDMLRFSAAHNKKYNLPLNYFPGMDGFLYYFTDDVAIFPESASKKQIIETIYKDSLKPTHQSERKVFFRAQDIDFSEFKKTHKEKKSTTDGIIIKSETNNPDCVKIQINAPVDGFLVRLENFHSGWKAFIDDENARILRANYAFQAIKLKKGLHRVSFQFWTPYPFLLYLHIGCVFVAWILFMWYLYYLRSYYSGHYLEINMRKDDG
jgi:hypothetical protein